jgi:hypothetical protein
MFMNIQIGGKQSNLLFLFRQLAGIFKKYYDITYDFDTENFGVMDNASNASEAAAFQVLATDQSILDFCQLGIITNANTKEQEQIIEEDARQHLLIPLRTFAAKHKLDLEFSDTESTGYINVHKKDAESKSSEFDCDNAQNLSPISFSFYYKTEAFAFGNQGCTERDGLLSFTTNYNIFDKLKSLEGMLGFKNRVSLHVEFREGSEKKLASASKYPLSTLKQALEEMYLDMMNDFNLAGLHCFPLMCVKENILPAVKIGNVDLHLQEDEIDNVVVLKDNGITYAMNPYLKDKFSALEDKDKILEKDCKSTNHSTTYSFFMAHEPDTPIYVSKCSKADGMSSFTQQYRTYRQMVSLANAVGEHVEMHALFSS